MTKLKAAGVILLLLGLNPPSQAAIQVGTENTFHAQGIIDVNFKNRSYIMFGAGSFHLGPTVYFQRPYEGFRDYIYGIGLRVGQKISFGLDAGLSEREVYGRKGRGYAGALVINYGITETWYLSLPFVYQVINEGDLPKRSEASFLPYLGVRFEI